MARFPIPGHPGGPPGAERPDRPFTGYKLARAVLSADCAKTAFAGLTVATPYLEKEREWWFWFLLTLCVGFAAFLLRMFLEAFTEIVLTFDGRSRTLTVDRTRPWRKTNQVFRFEDIVDAADRQSTIIAPDASLYVWVARSWWLDITLSSNRRIRLRADSQAETRLMPNAELRPIHSIWGHRAGNPLQCREDEAALRTAVVDLLAS